MRRVIVVLICLVSCAVFAQQPEEIRRRSTRTSEDGGGSGKRSDAEEQPRVYAKPAGNAEEATTGISTGNQENFGNIMGSFSDLAMKFSQVDAADTEIIVYECQHISGKSFCQAMEPFLSVNGELSYCVDSDLVVISDEHELIGKIREIAASIDRPVRQVLVSASVVEFQIKDGFEKDISLQYNQFVNMDQLNPVAAAAIGSRIMAAIVPSGANPATLGGTSSYMYYDPDQQAIFSAFLTFLESSGTAQILSSPSLILRRGHTGNILSGEDIPVTKSNVGSGGTSYSVDYKSVGIKLRVTPESVFDDRVVLEVSPEVSNIIRYEDSAAGRNPVVAIRNANTLLEMNDGYMVSIGGLLREEQIETERRVPILSSIPILGILFRSTSTSTVRSQLNIFLSVKIVNPDELAADTISPSTVTPELQNQIDAQLETIPAKKSTFMGGVKQLFQ